MPVDNFFLLPQEALVKLVDLWTAWMSRSTASRSWAASRMSPGVQTPRAGRPRSSTCCRKTKALGGTSTGLLRQRRVMLALFQRLSAREVKDLKDNIIGPVNERFDTHPQQLGHRSDALHADKTLQ